MDNAATSGEIVIENFGGQNGTKTTLQCYPGAMINISRMFGGMSEAQRRAAAIDMDAITFIVAQGLKLLDAAAQKGLEDKVYATGLIALSPVCIKYVHALSNGGVLPKDDAKNV